jgi:hypothetical protein
MCRRRSRVGDPTDWLGVQTTQEEVVTQTKLMGAAMTGCLLAALLGGCVAGPSALKVSRVRYNQAIQTTRTEQLLLNLVRLQYRERPLFLDVGTVTTQFSFRGSGNVGATLNEGPSPNPHQFNLGVGMAVEERPTITLTPLKGKDFANRLLTPLGLDVIVLLTRSGWSINRVLRLTVQNMNGLDNASSASGPTPIHPPQYEAFARVCKLWRELQKQGRLQLGHDTRSFDLSVPLPLERISLTDVIAAASQGYGLRTTEDGDGVVLTGSSQVLVWRIPPAAAASAQVQEITELLRLTPGLSRYEIRLGHTGQADPSTAPGTRTEIVIATRSLMGAMFYLSQAIEVPQPHRDKGLVTTTVDSTGMPFDWTQVTGDLLRIHSSKSRLAPDNAAVAVQHWGYWYYVDNANLGSKATITLLGQLFALQAGSVAGRPPVLTLPVGG